MAKIDVILTHNVMGLGGESDHVRVASGYARNYLFPRGFAIPLTGANKRRIEVLKQRRAEREAHELNTMTELGQSLSKLTLTITVKTGEEGKMFGSVTAGTICDELKHQFEAAVDKKKIHLLNPIKRLGDYDVELRLHPDVVATLKVRVQSSDPAANAALAAASAPPAPAPASAPEGKPAREDKGAARKPKTFRKPRSPRGDAKESKAASK